MEKKIIDFYSNKNSAKIHKLPEIVRNYSEFAYTTFNIGIGDSAILTSIVDKKIHFNTKPRNHLKEILKFNNDAKINNEINNLVRVELLENFDLGCGHLSQRLQRGLGLNVEEIPRPKIQTSFEKTKNKIGICLSTGRSAFDLLEIGFKNPRQIYKENIEIVKNFINESNFEFVEFGLKPLLISDKVKNFCGCSLSDSINELSTCEYFIGLNSGFMNLAAGLSIKSIIIVNVPKIENFYLPFLVDFKEGVDLGWLYPQNVHLHQDGENEIAFKFSLKNLYKAINGEIYPYFNQTITSIKNFKN